MKATQRNLAQACAAAFLLAGLAACGDGERSPGSTAKSAKPNEPSPSAVVIGQAPAEPTGDPAGTSPVSGGTTEVTKSVASGAMPQPGQPNDHSNVAAKPSQKAGEIATTVPEGKAANNGERTR